MSRPFTVLIAERNRHIRDLIKREISAEGYHVYTAANADQLLAAACQGKSPDIIVLDLDLPDAGTFGIIKEIQSLAPGIPVIVHALTLQAAQLSVDDAVIFVEKRENSIDQLKTVIDDILGPFPHRIQSR